MKRIYLDNNASTALNPEVVEAVAQELSCEPGNASSIHGWGQAAKKRLNGYRETIASYLQAKPNEIIFTSGGTESMNLLLRGLFSCEIQGHAISTNAEHSCVYATLLELQKKGLDLSFLPVGLNGAVTPEQIEEAIRPDTRFICVFAVNGETGVKHDLKAIGSIALKHKIPLFVDGVAWIGKEEISLYPGISGIGFSGHKCHAPKGTGFVYVHSDIKLTASITGARQEYGLRAGTENLPGIAGLAKAIEQLKSGLREATERMTRLRNQLEEGLLQRIDPMIINGTGARICNVTNLSFPKDLGEDLLIALDMAGIAVSHGSACSSGSLEPSRVLLQMGIPFSVAKSALRFSLSRYTTEEDIETTIALTAQIVNQLKH